jgi:hypothetical protein
MRSPTRCRLGLTVQTSQSGVTTNISKSISTGGNIFTLMWKQIVVLPSTRRSATTKARSPPASYRTQDRVV